MIQIPITRTVRIPDPIRLELYRRSPELGPRILFFSGGTALKKTSQELVRYTHDSIHIITPFDSGGSSAKLRDAFRMPAIGDIRNRLMALADRTLKGNPAIFKLFSYRFSQEENQAALLKIFQQMVDGHHPLITGIPDPMRKIIRHHLYLFQNYRPNYFDMRGASIGNLILTSGYLDNRRHLDPVIFIFSKLVNVLGTVRPVLSQYLHLIAELESGKTIVGQHRLTGKEVSPIDSPIRKIYVSDSRSDPQPVKVPIRKKMRKLINKATLICYPMGSFYSSLIANLLPEGVARAISRTPCPKVFIPNTGGQDPESIGLSLTDQIKVLLDYLHRYDTEPVADSKLLNFVLLDEDSSLYSGKLDTAELDRRGIQVIRCRLTSPDSQPYIDASLLVPVLLSLS